MARNKKTVSIITAFKDQGATAGLKRLFKQVKDVGKIKVPIAGPVKLVAGAALAGTGAVAGLGVVLRKVGSDVESLNKRAEALGVGIGFLDEMDRAGERLEIGAETMRISIARIKRSVEEFDRDGGGPAAETMARLNLELRDTAGRLRPIEDLLPEISDGLSSIGDEVERFEATKRLIGQDAPLLIGLISGGSGELARVRAEVRSVGGIITQAQADIISRMNTAFDLAKISIGARIRELVAVVAPFATEVLKRVTAAITIVPEITRRVVDLVRRFFGADSAVAHEISRQVQAVFESLLLVVFEGVTTILQFAGTVLVTSGLAIADNFIPRIFDRLTFLAKRSALVLIQEVYGTIESVFNVAGASGSGFARMVSGALGDVSDAIGGAVQTLDRADMAGRAVDARNEFERMGDVIRTIFFGLGEGSGALDPFRVALAGLGHELNEAIGLGDLFADAFRRIEDAVNGARLDAPPSEESRDEWAEFFRGIKFASTEAGKAVENAFLVGQQVGSTVIQSIGSGVTNVVDSLINRTQSLGDALRSLVANLLADLAKVAAQMLAIRAITGIIGGIGSGGGGGLGFSPSAGAASAPGGIGPVLGARGLVVAGSISALGSPSLASVPHAASGMVFNPRAGGQLAVLAEARKHEGAFPLTRMSNGDLGVQARIESGGGGGAVSYSYSPTVNINGSADEEMLRRVLADERRRGHAEFIEWVSRNPKARAQLNAAQGGRRG